MTLKEAYKDLLEQLLTSLRACERCIGEAYINKNDEDYLIWHNKSKKFYEEILILIDELSKAK